MQKHYASIEIHATNIPCSREGLYNDTICNSYMPLLGVHWSNEPQVQFCWPMHGPFLSSTYPMIIHTHHVAGNLPKKTFKLVAKQWPTNNFTSISLAYYNVYYTRILSVELLDKILEGFAT